MKTEKEKKIENILFDFDVKEERLKVEKMLEDLLDLKHPNKTGREIKNLFYDLELRLKRIDCVINHKIQYSTFTQNLGNGNIKKFRICNSIWVDENGKTQRLPKSLGRVENFSNDLEVEKLGLKLGREKMLITYIERYYYID